MEKVAAIQIRVPISVKEAAERAAKSDHRSVASWAKIILEKHLQENPPPRKAAK